MDSYLDVHYQQERHRRIFFCAYFTSASRIEGTLLLHDTCANIDEIAGAEPVLLHFGDFKSRRLVMGKLAWRDWITSFLRTRGIFGLIDTWNLRSERLLLYSQSAFAELNPKSPSMFSYAPELVLWNRSVAPGDC